jgi:uncharacterized membrane protein YraQ (UPF0718 family)
LLVKYLGTKSGVWGFIISALVGSIALIPAFICYPLCSILLQNGVSYPIVSVFITTLMMVGIITLPVEIKFFGIRVSVVRNLLSFIGALIIGIIMGLLL